jgi:hypothetical protein
MWTHISLNAQQVWEDGLWRIVAVWQENDGAEPVAIERSGRVALGTDRTPAGILLAAARQAFISEDLTGL